MLYPMFTLAPAALVAGAVLVSHCKSYIRHPFKLLIHASLIATTGYSIRNASPVCTQKDGLCMDSKRENGMSISPVV